MLNPARPLADQPIDTLEDIAVHTPRAPQGRKAVISSEELIAAALKLVGPHRSISTLSLREIAREAGIAPNSFYRHFRDIDELAIALIELAGASLRKVLSDARLRASMEHSIVQTSIDAFMEQLSIDVVFCRFYYERDELDRPHSNKRWNVNCIFLKLNYSKIWSGWLPSMVIVCISQH
jgi:AcrR family transcriptional regulator